MLTPKQAQEIVHASINKTLSSRAVLQQTESLSSIGISKDKLRSLVVTLASDNAVGVPRFQHYLDSNIIGDLSLGTSIDDLTQKILKLAAGKVCSNPKSPHPQQCCPYPAKCPQCGYPVL